MMLFTIVEPFSPADGERWTGYCEWRGINFGRFDFSHKAVEREN